jgi:hypothetical protein
LGFLVEEAEQALDVLSGRGQEELLRNKLHSKQAHATQSDLILQFREQCFYLRCLRVARCVRALWLVCHNAVEFETFATVRFRLPRKHQ